MRDLKEQLLPLPQTSMKHVRLREAKIHAQAHEHAASQGQKYDSIALSLFL